MPEGQGATRGRRRWQISYPLSDRVYSIVRVPVNLRASRPGNSFRRCLTALGKGRPVRVASASCGGRHWRSASAPSIQRITGQGANVLRPPMADAQEPFIGLSGIMRVSISSCRSWPTGSPIMRGCAFNTKVLTGGARLRGIFLRDRGGGPTRPEDGCRPMGSVCAESRGRYG